MGKVEGKDLKHFKDDASVKRLYVPELHVPREGSSPLGQICSFISLLKEDAKT